MNHFWIEPVFEREGKWFFYDETWSDSIGPFETRGEATTQLAEYARKLNYGDDAVPDECC